MNISYLDFWGGFDPNSNWFNLIFRDLFDGKDINFNSSPEEADLIFASGFGSERFKHKDLKAIKIFYTGENERAEPELDWADYSLTFDYDTHGGRNFRLPHWYMYINWWNEPNFNHSRISLEQLTRNFDPEEVWNREKFCSIVIGNPVQNRLEVATVLNEYKPVHGYGKVFGNHFDGCKVKVLENYRWNICFENSITDGYVTEKLLEAKVAGCIPLYYGPKNNDFNERCYINARFFDQNNLTKQTLETVMILESSKDKFVKLASEPLFKEVPNLDSLYNFLREALKGIL